MTILLVDHNNLGHRCRVGLGNEGSAFLYKYLRTLRALVAEVGATQLILVKEGSPDHRYEVYPEYKGNRRVKPDDPKANEKWAEVMAFKEKLDEPIDFCLKNLEVSVLKHPKLEADDLIANLARHFASKGKDVVVASNDQDFVQLLGDGDPRIRVYDTGAKDFVVPPTVFSLSKGKSDGLQALTVKQLITFKALTGDKSDNIPGVPGFGPKKALKAACDPGFDPATALSAESLATFERNVKLVEFKPLDDDGWRRAQLSQGRFDPAAIMVDFHMLDMPSMAAEPAYSRFIDTFGKLTRVTL